MTVTHPSFGKLDDNRIIIFDTTLRDGEQSPGFSMNLGEKIRMAEALTELGVDVLEAGFAIASPGDFESVKAIAESIGQRDDTPVIASLSRAISPKISTSRWISMPESSAAPLLVTARPSSSPLPRVLRKFPRSGPAFPSSGRRCRRPTPAAGRRCARRICRSSSFR